MVQPVGGFYAVFGASRTPAAPPQNEDFGHLVEALDSAAGEPETAAVPTPPVDELPAGGRWALQEIRSRQIWADEYNGYLRQCHESRVSNWEAMHRNAPDLAGPRPDEPIYQSTDPLRIAGDFDRLMPNPPGYPSFTEVVALMGGATGYQPHTDGRGLTGDWYEQENRWWSGGDTKPMA